MKYINHCLSHTIFHNLNERKHKRFSANHLRNFLLSISNFKINFHICLKYKPEIKLNSVRKTINTCKSTPQYTFIQES